VDGHVGAEFGRQGWEISFAVAAVVIVGRGLEVEFDFLTAVELGLGYDQFVGGSVQEHGSQILAAALQGRLIWDLEGEPKCLAGSGPPLRRPIACAVNHVKNGDGFAAFRMGYDLIGDDIG